MKTKKARRLSILSCLLFLLISCNHGNNPESIQDIQLSLSGDTLIVAESSPALSKITLQTIVEQSYNTQCIATGSVKALPGYMIDIPSPFEGRVVKSYVKLGQKVAAGEALFELNSSEYFESVKMYLQAKQEKHLAESNYHRKKDVFEAGVGSKKDLEEAESAYQFAIKESEKAEASLKIYSINPEETVLGKPLVVRSPVKGEVVKNNISAGQYLSIDAETVVTVADLSKVWIIAHVKENNIGLITQQDEVEVITEAYPDIPVKGIVDYIGNIMDEQTRSIEVYIECQNNDKMLKPGMFATVRFIHQINNVLVIPTSAVLQEEDKCYLFIKTGDNRFVKKPILVRTAGEKDLIVRSGIKPGDVIVSEGGIYLR